MSIPPLVCSTPPPPDQCEDDKDPEDFDMHYNLSQEEDYDYGSFSTYNHFQAAMSENKSMDSPINSITNNNVNNGDSTELDKTDTDRLQWSKVTTDENFGQGSREPKSEVKLNNHDELSTENKTTMENNLPTENKTDDKEEVHIDKKTNTEEEFNVEDLNLTVEEEESLSSNGKNEVNCDTDSDKFDSSDKTLHIPDMSNSIKDRTHVSASPTDDIAINSFTVENAKEQPTSIEEHESVSICAEIKNSEPNIDVQDGVTTHIPGALISKDISLDESNNETDDEFGDFSDFHVTSSNKPLTVDLCDNPWKNSQPDSNQTGSGAFEANFEEAESVEPPLFQGYEEKEVQDSPINNNLAVDDDDDFGDFDDFKSSAEETKNKSELLDPMSQVPVLDFQASESESQMLENINKILNTIFEQDIPEPDSLFDGKLESLLCETWGHLLETDVRQPYIVNWNSSFAQKTLLKALCIDSRNILFGPKWSYNMPKYAANLSVAPLQPQKQSTPSGPNLSEANPDKNSNKTSSTWTDPFTSDGQESCNKENNAAAQKRPNDLNVFDPPLPTKPDDIYSSTLGVQPIRQINLPDTHIFTPTDSETPRSKTIHYDGPTVFLSPQSIDNDKKVTEIPPVESLPDMGNKIFDDSDYADFQDFKGSFDVSNTESTLASAPSSNFMEPPANIKPPPIPSTSGTYSIGILQPIKIKPIMPTLNWPSPGEVKETFDDFSEFTANTTWSSETQEIQAPSIEAESIHNVENDHLNIKKDSSNKENVLSKINDSFDDDFESFQSALPISKPAPIIPSLNNFSNVTQLPSNQEVNLDFDFSKIDIVKSDSISLTRPNELKFTEPSIHQTDIDNTLKIKEPIVKIPAPHTPAIQPMPANVLQPIVSSSHVQSNTGQILQPLSLESFSQINWPNPGINLQDLSRFNPVETLNSLKSDLCVSGNSKGTSPVHNQKSSAQSQLVEDDIWGEFVSSKPKPQASLTNKAATFGDDDEWTDFVSSTTVKPQNGLNTISLNVHTNLSMQKTSKQNKLTVQNSKALEIPSLNYITPKSSNHSSYGDRHFQNL